jgi:hypothetical protein
MPTKIRLVAPFATIKLIISCIWSVDTLFALTAGAAGWNQKFMINSYLIAAKHNASSKDATCKFHIRCLFQFLNKILLL